MEAILAQLRYDLRRVWTSLDKDFPKWRTYPELVQRVLQNLVFNLDIARKWPIFSRQIRDEQWKAAAANLRANSIYVNQVGQRAIRLAMLLERVV
jgi:hypothetical protein